MFIEEKYCNEILNIKKFSEICFQLIIEHYNIFSNIESYVVYIKDKDFTRTYKRIIGYTKDLEDLNNIQNDTILQKVKEILPDETKLSSINTYLDNNKINDNKITLYNAVESSLMVCFAILQITKDMVGLQLKVNAVENGIGDYGIFISDLDGSNRTSNKANPYTIVDTVVGKLVGIRVRINGRQGTYTVSNIQAELSEISTPYEPYRGSITNYEFGVLGKNKCPLTTLGKAEILELGGEQTDNTTMRLTIENLVPSSDYTLSCLVTSQFSATTQDRLYLRGET